MEQSTRHESDDFFSLTLTPPAIGSFVIFFSLGFWLFENEPQQQRNIDSNRNQRNSMANI